MESVRGHEPNCPIARETWCLWPGDQCNHCIDIRTDLAEHAAELEFASLHEEGLA